MELEKQVDKTSWFSTSWPAYDTVKFKIEHHDESFFTIWITVENFNICTAMVMHDFFLRCEDEDISLHLDDSWNGHLGFKVENEDESFMMAFIIEFILTWELLTSKYHEEYIPDEIWYDPNPHNA